MSEPAKKKGRPKVAEWKIKQVDEIVNKLKGVSVVGLLEIKATPTEYFKRIRYDLKNDFQVLVYKKTLLGLALEKLGWKDLKEKLSDMPALVTTKLNPFQLYKKIYMKRAPTYAKNGQVSTLDITIPAGPTSIPAGPALGDFQKAGVTAKIEGGKISVVKDAVVAKKGAVISDDSVALLKKLDIKPFETMLNLVLVKEGMSLIPGSVLFIDEAKVAADFAQAHQWALGLALEAQYMTKDTVELLLLDAFHKAKALAISEALVSPELIEELLAMANYQANSIGGGDVEYVYAAMLLHKSGQKVDEAGVKKVLTAAGTKVDDARVKSLVAALEGVNIEEAIKKAPVAAAAPAAAAPAAGKSEAKKSAEDDKKSEEEAASGLASLFG